MFLFLELYAISDLECKNTYFLYLCQRSELQRFFVSNNDYYGKTKKTDRILR